MKETMASMSNLLELLRRKGITQRELASKCGVWPQQINAWIRGRGNISSSSLKKLPLH